MGSTTDLALDDLLHDAANRGWRIARAHGSLQLQASLRYLIGACVGVALLIPFSVWLYRTVAAWISGGPDEPVVYALVTAFLTIGILVFTWGVVVCVCGRVTCWLDRDTVRVRISAWRLAWTWTEQLSDVSAVWLERRHGRGGSYLAWIIQGRKHHVLTGFPVRGQAEFLASVIAMAAGVTVADLT